jgi:hypothetical protein
VNCNRIRALSRKTEPQRVALDITEVIGEIARSGLSFARPFVSEPSASPRVNQAGHDARQPVCVVASPGPPPDMLGGSGRFDRPPLVSDKWAHNLTNAPSHRRSGSRSPTFASSIICLAMIPLAKSSVSPRDARVFSSVTSGIRQVSGSTSSARASSTSLVRRPAHPRRLVGVLVIGRVAAKPQAQLVPDEQWERIPPAYRDFPC